MAFFELLVEPLFDVRDREGVNIVIVHLYPLAKLVLHAKIVVLQFLIPDFRKRDIRPSWSHAEVHRAGRVCLHYHVYLVVGPVWAPYFLAYDDRRVGLSFVNVEFFFSVFEVLHVSCIPGGCEDDGA